MAWRNTKSFPPRPRLTLGECLNRCVEASTGAVLTRMDGEDYYAPNYLVDLLHALTYSGADVVGKQSHYIALAFQPGHGAPCCAPGAPVQRAGDWANHHCTQGGLRGAPV